MNMVNAKSSDDIRIETPGDGAVTAKGSVWLHCKNCYPALVDACETALVGLVNYDASRLRYFDNADAVMRKLTYALELTKDGP